MPRYSPQTNTWSSAASLPIPLNHANAAVVNGGIYLIGGLTPDPANPASVWIASRKCFLYKPEPDSRKQLSSDIPEGRQIGAAAVGVKGNTIYLAGGITYLNLSETYQPSVDWFTAYNTGRESWTTLPRLPLARDHAGKGDDWGEWTVLCFWGKEVWRSEKAEMPTARGVASAVVGKQAFAMGGEGNPGASTRVFPQNEAYDTERDEWREYAEMDVPRHGTSAVAVGKRIYVPGGGLTEGGDPTDYFSYFEVP